MEGDCVMLMLCLGIARSHVHSVEAVQSRTYFLDRAAEKVNRRMLLDEERERMRR